MQATTGKQATARELGIVRSLASSGKSKAGAHSNKYGSKEGRERQKKLPASATTLATAKETTKVL